MSLRFDALVFAAVAWLAGPPALAADAAQGRALYESRCDACHDKSVHNRAARKSRDIDELRRWVERWNSELGGAWKDPEIDAVTRYLNQRYYHFPCPPRLCAGERA